MIMISCSGNSSEKQRVESLLVKKQGFVVSSSIPVIDLLIGNIHGSICDTSSLAFLIGAVILLAFKVIDLKVPLTYIGSFTVFVIFYMLGSGMGFDGN